MTRRIVQPTTLYWSRHAVVYQIYPRSFKDTNGDGIGDLKGIIDRLDYLNDDTGKSLGIDAIWLSPIYKSPMKDFGYDVSDYEDIDPVFGSLKDFDKLVKEAHKRGIKIIMDFVPNHTSSLHLWFLESRSSKNNPKRDWYIWRDRKSDGSPPNNWLSPFGGSAWEFDKHTAQYYLHTFLPEQPDLNWQNKDVVEEMKKILLYWISKGVDGFRLDAIGHLAKHKDLLDEPQNPSYNTTDNPYKKLLHVYSGGVLEVIPIIENFCKVVGKERFMLGEISPSLEKLPEFYKACLQWNGGQYAGFSQVKPWLPLAENYTFVNKAL